MSQINVNRIKDSNKGAPDFPSGVNVGGITSTVTLGVTNLNPTNLNVSGVVTATTLDGNLLATGTPTLGLGVTINTSGVNISGVATAGIVSATTLYGDGSNLTGIALTIAPLNYNPAVYSQASHLTKASGIGLTFNQAVKAGSGNVTLSLANAGVAGTVVENFGVGNSVTYSNGDTITITPTADLSVGQNYHLNYPAGAFTNIGGDLSSVGIAYTFQARTYSYSLFTLGEGGVGRLGQNSTQDKSSPVQVPGTTWTNIGNGNYTSALNAAMIKSDGTLWVWGFNGNGHLGQGNNTEYSSPIQIGSGTDWATVGVGLYAGGGAIKTDGTLWAWGNNGKGQLGQNNTTPTQSPVQIPGTTWSKVSGGREGESLATKTDGTLWSWGNNENGELGQNNRTLYSSPTQIPGTTWSIPRSGNKYQMAIKTDGTLWSWGYNHNGNLGQNNQTKYSSPVQIPGTTWRSLSLSYSGHAVATKTDGTLWVWGDNNDGALGLHDPRRASSPVQIPGTDWTVPLAGEKMGGAINTSGECWVWGQNNKGQLGQNNQTYYSSPVQIPGTSWNDIHAMAEVLILQTKV